MSSSRSRAEARRPVVVTTYERRWPGSHSRRTLPIPRRRFYRPVQAPIGPRTNDRIRISPVRLIDENGEMAGVVETDEARRRASELGLDLVEIAADVRPPVCRIMDFGKFKYEKSKKDRANKSKSAELKEVRLGRSMKIDPHDIQIRLKQARKFLLEGHKVQIVQNFRGREMAHKDRGNKRMSEIVEQMDDIAKVELFPRMAGRRMTMVLAPDRQKIVLYLRTHKVEELEDVPPPPDEEAPEAVVPNDAEAPEAVVPNDAEAPEAVVPNDAEAPEAVVPNDAEAPEAVVPNDAEAETKVESKD